MKIKTVAISVLSGVLILLIGITIGEYIPFKFIDAYPVRHMVYDPDKGPKSARMRDGIVILREPPIPLFGVTTSTSTLFTSIKMGEIKTASGEGFFLINLGLTDNKFFTLKIAKLIRNTGLEIDNWEYFCPLRHYEFELNE